MKQLLIISLLVLFACNKEEVFDGPDNYADDFESYGQIDDIIDGNNEKWSFFQLTAEGNALTVDTSIYHSGTKSIKSEAITSTDAQLSKCSINKQFMAFWEDEVVRADFWVYLVGDASCEWLFLFDLEEKVPVGAGPGMRLALVDNKITLEHKFPNPNVHQDDATAIDFPRDQWVNLVFETKLSRKKNGYVKVWQDDVLIIDQNDWKTLPKDILYFQQGTKGGYSQIEFGITANTFENDMVMYVDDIVVEVVE